MKKSLLIFGVVALAAVAIASTLVSESQPQLASLAVESVSNSAVTEQATQARTQAAFSNKLSSSENDKIFSDFSQWLAESSARINAQPALDAAQKSQWIARGKQLAKQRTATLATLLETEPELALRKALSFAEYAALPAEIAVLVEKPFSELVDLSVLPTEPNKDGSQRSIEAAESAASVSMAQSSEEYEAIRFGRRLVLDSKDSLATQGFTLGGVAVIDELPLREVSGAEAAYALANFKLSQSDSDAPNDAFTGEPLPQQSIIAIGGGQVFYFASRRNLESLNTMLLELEQRPGPNNGSPLLFKSMAKAGYSDELLQAQGANSGSPLQDQLLAALAADNPWTNTKKDVFFIRIDFSDKPATDSQYALPSEAQLSTVLNTDVSDQIRNMSRARTWIDADVSAAVVRMPQTSLQYTNSGTTALYNDALAAYTASGTGISLDDYDIIGVYFTDIDTEESDAFNFGGLAGGSRQWIQDSTSTFLFVHEFGHNYGLGHASFWATTNGSVVGAGTSQEYGNTYDILGGLFNSNGYFHPQGLERLDWIDPEHWVDVSSSGLHRIHRFDDPLASGVQTARITKGNSEYYWLGHRQLFANSYLRSGLQLLWQRPGQVRSWLVDTTPGSADGKLDTAIGIGRTYADPAAEVYITPLATGGVAPNEWVEVQINLGDFSSNQAPVVSISGSATANAREATVFSATASDPDNDDLAYQWDFGDGVTHSSTSSVQQTWTVGGSYTVTLTVSDMKGQTASASMQVVVSDPLDTWVQRATGGRTLLGIATDGTQIIAVGDGGTIRRSLDGGQTWLSDAVLESESGGSVGFVGNLSFNDVNYSGSIWTAVGDDYDFSISQSIGQIFTSSDGITWRRRLDGGSPLRGIASNSSTRVVTGYDGVVMTSSDGITWLMQTSNTDAILNQVAFGNGNFVAVGQWRRSSPGSNGITYDQATVLVSSDGETWQETTSGTGLTFQGLEHVQFVHDQFIANGFRSALLLSSNGQSFSENYSNDRDEFAAFSFGNGVYLAAGASDGGVQKNLFSSNGVDWLLGQTIDQPDRNDALFFGNTFITVGSSGSIYQSNSFSPNGQVPNADGDAYPDSNDNCPTVPNDDQANSDNDSLGDACDDDDDNDNTLDVNDCAPLDNTRFQNYSAYVDSDQDTIGTGALVTVCGGASLPSQYTQNATGDNCPAVSNTNQANFDNDGNGDACDTNDDNDPALDVNDCAPLDDSVWNLYSVYQDADGDNIGTGQLVNICGNATPPANYTANATGDNCPAIANADQTNNDNDSLGDACDADDDNDQRDDVDDCAPLNALAFQSYSAYQDTDSDNIGTGDLVNLCAGAALPAQYTENATDDNCPAVSNAAQINSDMDGLGDACDDNDDNDVALDADDCAPIDDSKWMQYTAYLDADSDDVGTGALISVCGAATLPQNHTTLATGDNCPGISNTDQVNTDGDSEGDECDSDRDNDGVLNGADDNDLNPRVCEDSDLDTCNDCSIGRDGFGPLFDALPANDGIDTDTDGMCNAGDTDDDDDMVPDLEDNCRLVPNDQTDSDGNGIGDACDGAAAEELDVLDFLPAIISASKNSKK